MEDEIHCEKFLSLIKWTLYFGSAIAMIEIHSGISCIIYFIVPILYAIYIYMD